MEIKGRALQFNKIKKEEMMQSSLCTNDKEMK